MEALGEAQETADLIAYYCAQMEAQRRLREADGGRSAGGFRQREPRACSSRTASWLVIAPFNFPLALAGGPAGAALVGGQHRRVQGGVDDAVERTPAGRRVPRRGRAAGRVQFRDRAGRVARRGADPASGRGGRHVHRAATTSACISSRTFARGRWPRPCIAEMGGKNAAIVSRHANLHDAATGVARSAFGLSGQKCSACSRVYVEHTVFADFVAALHGGDREDRRRRPDAARALDGARDRRGGGRALRGRGGAGPGARRGGQDRPRRRAPRPRRPRARPLLRADDRARAARPSAVAHGAVRAVRARRAR